MQVTLKVRRFDPESTSPQPYTQDYPLDVPDYFTVLESLIRVREEIDPTLALRCSCRASICGSCAMRIDGRARLACKTKLVNLTADGGAVSVGPVGNMPVIKDLVTDMQIHWDKVRSVEPFLQPHGPEPEDERAAPHEAMLHLAGVMGCIMCAACVSDCTVLEIDSRFLGPAALAKAYRFVADPRDDATQGRLGALVEHGGIWDCTRCMECVQVCPKGVAPMDRIMAMRHGAMQAGYTNSYGARHAIAFEELVEHGGTLDELRLTVQTVGLFNIPKLLSFVPVGLRAFRRRKLPPLIHKTIPGIRNIRRIFEKVESQK